jgi:hypothetical protein
MSACLGGIGEQAGGLDNDIGAHVLPLERQVFFSKDLDRLAIHDKRAVFASTVPG